MESVTFAGMGPKELGRYVFEKGHFRPSEADTNKAYQVIGKLTTQQRLITLILLGGLFEYEHYRQGR